MMRSRSGKTPRMSQFYSDVNQALASKCDASGNYSQSVSTQLYSQDVNQSGQFNMP